MGERVFCIDLGSGYTKVGLRTAPDADTTLLASPTVLAGGVDFCLPTVVAVDQTSGTRQYQFGYEALDRKPGDQVRVFANWKRWAFEAGKKLVPSGLHPLLASEEFAALAGRFQVPLAQVQGLRQLVAASHQLNGGPPPSVEPLEVRYASVLAEKFFRFLRTFVLDACRRMETPPEDVESIPAVLTAPAFSPETELPSHPGVKLLSAALARAGWPVRTHSPVVSEPFSNAVGVLTGGVNALKTTRAKTKTPVTRMDLGRMFKKGPILTAVNDGTHYPLYRALVVDVGAYTTDVAVVELPTAEMDDFTPAAVRVRQTSVPLGVHEIDDRVRAVLPPRQAEYLLGQMSSADWEDFRQTVYDGKSEKPFRTLEGSIGGKKDGPAVRAVLEGFGREVAGSVVGFCGELPPANMQELILTGGGNGIPAVRAAVEAAVALPGSPIVRVLSPTRKTAVAGANARHLDERASRGGSALGGCSIFFESQYW
jgi:hypothetical protein